MNEQRNPNVVLEFLGGIAEILGGIASAIRNFVADWWLPIILVIVLLVVGYGITKPGWDSLAAGKGFFISEFEARDRIVQECLASERYTREECISLATKQR